MSLHTLPDLGYEYSALEPHIDAKTMKVHHDLHHQGYLDKFNATLEKYPDLADMGAEDILKNISSLDVEEADRTSFRNNCGGFLNHNLYFSAMGPEKKMDTALVEKIVESFGSLEKFKEEFSSIAAAHFGSGWAFAVRDENNKLKIYSLPNQDSPLSLGHTPIFNLDIWEHAYYLKYQNKRADYIKAWWNVLKLI